MQNYEVGKHIVFVRYFHYFNDQVIMNDHCLWKENMILVKG